MRRSLSAIAARAVLACSAGALVMLTVMWPTPGQRRASAPQPPPPRPGLLRFSDGPATHFGLLGLEAGGGGDDAPHALVWCGSRRAHRPMRRGGVPTQFIHVPKARGWHSSAAERGVLVVCGWVARMLGVGGGWCARGGGGEGAAQPTRLLLCVCSRADGRHERAEVHA